MGLLVATFGGVGFGVYEEGVDEFVGPPGQVIEVSGRRFCIGQNLGLIPLDVMSGAQVDRFLSEAERSRAPVRLTEQRLDVIPQTPVSPATRMMSMRKFGRTDDPLCRA